MERKEAEYWEQATKLAREARQPNIVQIVELIKAAEALGLEVVSQQPSIIRPARNRAKRTP
jgi:hypothetical protein